MSSSHYSTPRGDPEHRSVDACRAVFDRVADAIIIHARNGHSILDANPAALKRYGYTLEEFRSMTPFDLHPSEDAAAVGEKIDECNPDAPNVYVHLTKDGVSIPVEILSDVIDYDGTPAWLSMVRDIRERKRFEIELAKVRDEAVAASQHKSRFIAGISHELRTPMNGVMGMAALLMDTDLDDEQREYANTIQSTANVMLDLLNEILDLSKIEAGKFELEPLPFRLRKTFHDVFHMLQPRTGDTRIELRLDFDESAPELVVGDSHRLRQVITNLAGNALKFTSEGHVTLRLACVDTINDSTWLRIEVEDTGIGIAPDKLEAIFEEFAQADESTSRRYGGTGLGLTISRRIVELMGGRMYVRSSVGHGSTFSFEIEMPVANAADLSGSGPLDLAGSALVVHSDAAAREYYLGLLEQFGFDVYGASSAVATLELCRGELAGSRMQLCLLEYTLPDMDGETLGLTLRRQKIVRRGSMHLLGRVRGIDPERLAAKGFGGIHDALDAEGFEKILGVNDESTSGEPANENRDQQETIDMSTKVSAAHAPHAAGRCIRVLIVEDNLVNQRVTEQLLRKLGCECDLAADGVEALQKIACTNFDLVVMDCQMPEMDGYEATRAIRSLPFPQNTVAIVALTANAMDGDREKCLEAGMDDYLSKPASASQIAAMVRKWATKHSDRLPPEPVGIG
jgi:PAS domain S-box-containing protein